jgi:hypothetical protein
MTRRRTFHNFHWVRLKVSGAWAMAQMYDWLADHKFDYVDIDPGLTPKTTPEVIWDFGFTNINEALIFKLTWSGV